MKMFEYTITNPQGMHSRPAGQLVRRAAKFKSDITLERDGEKANAKRVFSVMGLGLKCAQTVKVNVAGPDEDAAALMVKSFLERNM